MGIDLKAMASQFRERRGELLPTATLRFERDPRLFSRMSADVAPCLVHSFPEGLKTGCYEDDGLIFTDVDRYGRRLMYTTPTELQRLELPEAISPWNRAVLAFLLALPSETRIVLYWC
jgi:hypothetical protein